MTLCDLLTVAVSHSASDLHLTVGAPPTLRVLGTLQGLAHPPITPDDTERMIAEVLTEVQRARLKDVGEVDLSFSLAEVGRFRLCVYRRVGGFCSISARVLTARPRPLTSLHLPDVVAGFSAYESGLIVVTGPAGSGKSTTLAALVDHMNRHLYRRIITLEDPVECLHEHGRCLIDQREVGVDTASFAQGLRAALRQDPDVIMIGEVRDADTLDTVLTAAETGHLVLTTLHTGDAVQAIDRIVDAFAATRRQQVRSQLAGALRAVVAQMLVPASGGRELLPIVEILINTPAIANLIRSDKGQQIRSLMQTGRAQGMQTMETAAREAVMSGRTQSDALWGASFTGGTFCAHELL